MWEEPASGECATASALRRTLRALQRGLGSYAAPLSPSFNVLRPLRALLKSWRVRPMAAATAGAEFALGTRELAALSSPCGWRLMRLCKTLDLSSLSFFNALEFFQAV